MWSFPDAAAAEINEQGENDNDTKGNDHGEEII